MAAAPGGRMNFDTLAPHYRWMEFVLAGGKLQRSRTAFLDQVADARDILILGEGNGRFLVECRRRLPDARITCVDSSARMLGLARSRLKRAGLSANPVTFVRADALSWNAPESWADLLVTHFFLDCFRAAQLELIAGRLARAARPDASWLIADFQAPPAGLARWRACAILKAMYVFFRVVTRLPASELTPPDAYLEHHGFKLQRRLESEWGLLRSDHWKRSRRG